MRERSNADEQPPTVEVNVKIEWPRTTEKQSLGIVIQMRRDTQEVFVKSIEPGSRANLGGLRQGDKIISVNTVPIRDKKQTATLIKESLHTRRYCVVRVRRIEPSWPLFDSTIKKPIRQPAIFDKIKNFESKNSIESKSAGKTKPNDTLIRQPRPSRAEKIDVLRKQQKRRQKSPTLPDDVIQMCVLEMRARATRQKWAKPPKSILKTTVSDIIVDAGLSDAATTSELPALSTEIVDNPDECDNLYIDRDSIAPQQTDSTDTDDINTDDQSSTSSDAERKPGTILSPSVSFSRQNALEVPIMRDTPTNVALRKFEKRTNNAYLRKQLLQKTKDNISR